MSENDGLIERLRNGDDTERFKAAQALGAAREQAAVPLLIETLGHDSAEGVRWAAVEALAAIGDQRAVEPLATLLNDRDRDWRVRRAAAERLRGFGDKSAIGSLVTALRDPDARVQAEALVALRALDKREPMQRLLRELVSGIHVPGGGSGEGMLAVAVGAGDGRALLAVQAVLTDERVAALRQCHIDSAT
jgi:HEAT repeat protein